MYITLAELKTRMGVTGIARDAELQQLIDDTSALLSAMGADYTSKLHTKVISNCDFCGCYIYLDHPEVTAINSIDGVPYAGVLDTDYFVTSPMNARVLMVSNIDFPTKQYFKLEYTAGYNPIPEDLKLLQYQMTQLLVTAGLNVGGTITTGSAIKKVKLGPKEIQYDSDATTESNIEKYKADIDGILSRYHLPTIRTIC